MAKPTYNELAKATAKLHSLCQQLHNAYMTDQAKDRRARMDAIMAEAEEVSEVLMRMPTAVEID